MTPSAKEFYDLVTGVEQELYPGCKEFSKLSFVIRFFHIKCQYRINNSACSQLLKLFKQALPTLNTLPDTFYFAKKMIMNLGFDYNKIDVCQSRCTFYMNEHSDDDICTVCNTSRWKRVDEGASIDAFSINTKVATILYVFCRLNNHAFSINTKVARILNVF